MLYVVDLLHAKIQKKTHLRSITPLILCHILHFSTFRHFFMAAVVVSRSHMFHTAIGCGLSHVPANLLYHCCRIQVFFVILEDFYNHFISKQF